MKKVMKRMTNDFGTPGMVVELETDQDTLTFRNGETVTGPCVCRFTAGGYKADVASAEVLARRSSNYQVFRGHPQMPIQMDQAACKAWKKVRGVTEYEEGCTAPFCRLSVPGGQFIPLCPDGYIMYNWNTMADTSYLLVREDVAIKNGMTPCHI